MDTAAPSPLPPVVFHDGFGQRRRIVGARNSFLSVLFLDGALTEDPSFEQALRARVEQLASFQDQSYARVRGVVHVTKTPLRLALASEYVPGPRLSEMLQLAESRQLPLDLDAALCVIQQVASAVAALHEHAPDACHGALAPERIVVAAEARVTIVEHVLGGALEGLPWAPERLWQSLRIAVPAGASPRLDRRTDVLQLGLVALALIARRPLREDEYPSGAGRLLASLQGLSARGLEPLPGALTTWLRRALQLEGAASFSTAIEANVALAGITAADDGEPRRALQSFLAQCHATQSFDASSPATAPVITAAPSPEAAAEATQAPAAPDRTEPAGEPILDEAPGTGRGSELPAASAATTSLAPATQAAAPVAVAVTSAPRALDPFADPEPVETPETVEPAGSTRRWGRGRTVAAATVLLALVTAATVAARRHLAVEPQGTLVVTTNPAGATVVVDGQHRGSTPLTLELPAGGHQLQIVADGQVHTTPITVIEGARNAQFMDLAPAPPVADGQLDVQTNPPGAVVLVDGEHRGVSPVLVEHLAPGEHAVRLENDGGAVTEKVTIEAGATASLSTAMPAPQPAVVSGWVSITAPVEVQLYENGRLLGTSGDRIALPAGRHTVDVVNVALGYRAARAIQITAGEVTPLPVEWPRGSLAVNALPWAEVWLDGERVGETPLGNVQVPIGPHRVVFRHPELGERARDVVVTASAPARVIVDLRTP